MSQTPPAVLVTGASTGIGATIARRLDRLGYRVFAGVRRAADGDTLASQLSDRSSWLILDVTDQDQIEAAARAVAAECGSAGLDGLVNNAGIGVGGPLEFVPLPQFRRQLEVNVTGLVAVTQAMLPLLRDARGRIVNIGSIAGKSVAPMTGPYCASKYAVEALTDAFRLELFGTGIEVSVVEPGAVRTPIWSKAIAELEDVGETLPPRALELYGRYFGFFGKLLAANDRRGVSPELVADAVEHALTAERPKTRYLVGADAKLRALVRWLLPDRWHDALVLAVLRRAQSRLR